MNSKQKTLLTLTILALTITAANSLEFRSNQPIDFHNNLDLKDNYITNNNVEGGIKINTTSGNSKWIFEERKEEGGRGDIEYLPFLSIVGEVNSGGRGDTGDKLSTDIGVINSGFSISHSSEVRGQYDGLGLATGGRNNDLYLDEYGQIGIGTTTPSSTLDVNGSTDLRGNLDINGNNITSSTTGNVSVGQDLKVYGDVWTQGADLAEIYSSPQKLEPGDVVAINTGEDNSVVKTSEKYQETVTGVISTNPGQTLNWQEKGYPVALTGKVPVKVSEENGEIQRGDRLTPSTEDGVAMKCETWNPTQKTDTPVREIIAHNQDCKTSTIGKALENSENKDKILVKVD